MSASLSSEVLISGIIPTVGRADYLRKCLNTLVQQTLKPREVLIVHCGTDTDTQAVAEDPCWAMAGIQCRYFHHPQRNAAAQRNFAVTQAKYPWLLLLDDDLELEPEWTESLLAPMLQDDAVGATVGCLKNQPPLIYKSKTWKWHHYLTVGASPTSNQGKLVGAVLCVGFETLPTQPAAMEWLSGGACAIRRSAFEAVGGFAPYFMGSSCGEDFDLGYRISRHWKVLFAPAAKAYHHTAGQGREPRVQTEYFTARSRYAIQICAMGRTPFAAQCYSLIYALFLSASEFLAAGRGASVHPVGRLRARLAGWMSCWLWTPPKPQPWVQLEHLC